MGYRILSHVPPPIQVAPRALSVLSEEELQHMQKAELLSSPIIHKYPSEITLQAKYIF